MSALTAPPPRQPDMGGSDPNAPGDGETLYLGAGWLVTPPDATEPDTLDLIWDADEGRLYRAADIPPAKEDEQP
jgi:hypothetical protein